MAALPLFISYRRDSDLLRAVLLEQFLTSAFKAVNGESAVQVFMDSGMRLGRQWPGEIRIRLAESAIVLVIVGPGWLGAKDEFERRRIDQADDWVRQEIEYAIAQGKVIIPISFQGALPREEALPASIKSFVSWQGAEVHDATISRDLEPVYQEIRRHLSSAAPAPAQPTAERRLPYPNPPMKFKPAPIAGDELALVVAEELTEWSIQTGPVPGKPGVTGVELHRDLQFPRFRDVLPYMAIVADFAQKANHHPRWENIFRTLSINLTTWDIGHQVSILDVVLAAYCDRAYLQYIDSLGSPSDAAHTRSSQ